MVALCPKMITLLTFCCALNCLSFGGADQPDKIAEEKRIERTRQLVARINAKQSLWKAHAYEMVRQEEVAARSTLRRASEEEAVRFGSKAPPAEPEGPFCSVEPGTKSHRSKRSTGLQLGRGLPTVFTRKCTEPLPSQFDARTQWPHCADIINLVPTQGMCGCCWALASASAISDRICIASGGKHKVRVSTKELISCAVRDGCTGGQPSYAFHYWKNHGLLGADCQPYPQFEPGYRLQCNRQCDAFAASIQSTQKYFGKSTKWHRAALGLLGGHFGIPESAIRREILRNGPVVVNMDVPEDFDHYKSGIYKYVEGKNTGGHAVRLIGWGEEWGVKFWLAVNSWGPHWGEAGLFRIVRGQNHCAVEYEMFYAQPDFGRK